MNRPNMISTPMRALRAGEWLVVLSHYPAGRGLGRHSHGGASFHLTVEGSSDESYWRFDRRKLPGTAQYYASGVEHETVFGPGGAVVLHALRDGIDQSPAARAGSDVMREPNPRHLVRVMRELGSGDHASRLLIEGWCAEMESEIGPGKPALRESAWPGWLTRVRQRLHDDLAPGLTLAQIADEEDLNPSHLARTFRDRIGMSPGAYLRRRRLEAAARWLVSTNRPITAIAIDAGFYDQSHFGRLFLRTYGSTPASFRREFTSSRPLSTRR